MIYYSNNEYLCEILYGLFNDVFTAPKAVLYNYSSIYLSTWF